MAVLEGSITIKESDKDLVYSSDTDVDVDPEVGDCGWIPEHLARAVRPGADRVRVRGLNADQHTKIRDIKAKEGQHAAFLAYCRQGLVEVNGSKKRTDIDAWVGKLAVHGAGAMDMLALVIQAITVGRSLEDLRSFLRAAIERETERLLAPHVAEGQNDEATKSAA